MKVIPCSTAAMAIMVTMVFPSTTSAFVCPSTRTTFHLHRRSSAFPKAIPNKIITTVVATTPSSPRTSTTSLSSAKILPIAYTAVSAALFEKAWALHAAAAAPTTTAAQLYSKIILVATGILSLVKYGPSDNAKLASSKRAYKATPPASSGKAKQQRQAVKTWKSVVRIKLIGQFVGLLYMARSPSWSKLMQGAMMVMTTNVAYYLCGAGRSYHDDHGNWTPLPTEESSICTLYHTVLMICTALLAKSSSSALEQQQAITTPLFFNSATTILVGIYVVGAFVSTLTGIPKFLQTLSGVFKQKQEEEE
mmetsp:Transcript_10439/g.13618  ORF Transcript_10439/g.13618 Transcript_10439/m.13618 type:complete len:307 (+) Transcript_10439:39-959(+)